MIVEIDDKSGFCFGVVTAIEKAETALRKGFPVFSLGDIMHNHKEMSRLAALGLRTVTADELPAYAGQTVLIRAHGEPPATYASARRYGVRLIDATCPVVAALQKKVIEADREMQVRNGQVVILGKQGHPEVIGLNGQIDNRAAVIEREEDLERLDFSRPVYLLSQTTQSLVLFKRIAEKIRERAQAGVTVRDTICRQVSNRFDHLREFASRYDLILFVSGAHSSNGKALFENCREANPKCYKIEDAGGLRPEWFDNVRSIGICGATSTPKWLMEEIAAHIRTLFGSETLPLP